MKCLCKAGLTLKPSKCQWARTEVIYLGHLISGDGIKPNPGKITAVQNFPVPKNKAEVRTFLGLASYYRRFIDNFASIAKPSTELTKLKRNLCFRWTPEAESAFNQLKGLLIKLPYWGDLISRVLLLCKQMQVIVELVLCWHKSRMERRS